MFIIIVQILRRPAQILIWFVTVLVFLALTIWLPQLGTLKVVLGSDVYSFFQKMNILVASLGNFKSALPIPTQIISVIIAFLAGMNISLSVYYIRRRLKTQKVAGVGLFGMIVGLFGVGCSSCGSVLLSSFLGVGVTSGIVTFLPLHGLEFGILSISILIISIYSIARQITRPSVCAIEIKKEYETK